MGDPVSKRINVRDFLEKIFDGRERTTKERELCRFSGPRQIWIKALIEFTDVSYESVGVPHKCNNLFGYANYHILCHGYRY